MVDNKQKSGFKKFFKDNRSLMYTIPVLIVLVVAVVVVYILSENNKTADNQPAATPTATEQQTEESTPAPSQSASESDGTEVTTLPQDERDKDDSELMRNPFADPYKVSGIIYDEKGGSIAIIEAENKTFIVKTDDQVGEYFKVLNIEFDRVVLEIEGQEIVLVIFGE